MKDGAKGHDSGRLPVEESKTIKLKAGLCKAVGWRDMLIMVPEFEGQHLRRPTAAASFFGTLLSGSLVLV
jgi:hypothetical protein